MSSKDLDKKQTESSINPELGPNSRVSNKLEYTLDNFYRNSFLAYGYEPKEFRSNLKLWASGILALSLWALLGILAWSHFDASRQFANRISTLKPQQETDGTISLMHHQEVQLIEKANTIVDSTSNRLYTFLTPIVTAITGYFFVSSATKPKLQPGSSRKPKE